MADEGLALSGAKAPGSRGDRAVVSGSLDDPAIRIVLVADELLPFSPKYSHGGRFQKDSGLGTQGVSARREPLRGLSPKF